MIIRDIDELRIKVSEYKKQGKKIVWTNGCFDIVHPGHIQMFQKAKEHGDIFIIGLNGDKSPYRQLKPGRPINDEDFRAQILDVIRYVDEIFIYDEPIPILPIQAILPDIIIKGGDYTAENVIGYKEVVENGGKVIIIPTVEGYSTTKIVEKVNRYKD